MRQQTLLGDRAIFFLQSDPEAERSVINDQLGRAGQAQAFELPKQFTPGLAAFVISKKTTAGNTPSWLFLNRQIMFPTCKPQNVDRSSASESS
jgi:hypothetical protein